MHATFLEWEVCQGIEGQQAKLSGSKEHVEICCEWYETTTHEASTITLLDVQKWMEEFQGNANEEIYMLKTINWKLIAKYGDSLRFTSCEGRPSIMLLHEEAYQIVLESPMETVPNSCNVEKDLRDFVFVGREIAQCLHESSEREEYPYPAALL